MTVLSVANEVADLFGLPTLTTIVGSTNDTARKILATINDIGREIRDRHAWPELHRSHTVTLVAGQASYALPGDHDRWVSETGWNTSRTQPIAFPTGPAEWNLLKYGASTPTLLDTIRVYGATDRPLFITPTPTSANAGQVIALEYISSNWIRPKTWTTATVFAASAYCFYNGNYYQTTAGGTTGATPPTHTTGSSSDGAVTWTYYSSPYSFSDDRDTFIIDETVLAAGALYLFAENNGMQFASHQRRFEEKLLRAKMKKKGSKPLDLNARAFAASISSISSVAIPYGSWSST